jgi:hypothetical protein
MDDLEQLIRGSESKVTPQAGRDQERLDILNQELRKAQAKAATGDQRAAGDVEALLREIGGKSKVKAAPADELESLILGTGKVEAPAPKKQSLPAELKQQMETRPETFGEFVGKKIAGAGEAGLAALTGAVAAPASAVAGLYESLTGGKYGTQEGVKQGQQRAAEVQQALTYQPRTAQGQEYLQTVGKALEASKVPPVAVPELMGMAPVAGAAQQQLADQFARARMPVAPGVQSMQPAPTPVTNVNLPPAMRQQAQAARTAQPGQLPPQVIQQMQQQLAQRQAPQGSLGAAAADPQTFLNQAIAQATPELAAELKTITAKDANIPAITIQLEADQLPVPIRLTKGQATQDPVLISRERNERGFKEQFAQRLNEQNKALQENASLMKERVAPDVFTTDYVADAGNVSDAVNAIMKRNAQATKEAYDALKAANGGKFPVDGQLFADNALQVLNAEDRLGYLPTEIRKKLDDYSKGKEMNFNLFENLRTDLAAEIRKAQRANDGTTVNALGKVRDELEKLPMRGEAPQLKALADKARNTAKYDFDLERNNKLYSDVVNQTGAVDTKDLIQNFVIRSKNKDFADSMNLLRDNDQAIQNLRAGTLDYIIRESTDASGNFLTGKFAKSIENLDVNKKLDALFGSEAQTLRNIAKTGRLIEARPKGSFVNESNTATAAAAMAKQYGERLLGRLPVVGAVVEPATELIRQRKAAKETKESLKVGAGTRLSDIGKEK